MTRRLAAAWILTLLLAAGAAVAFVDYRSGQPVPSEHLALHDLPSAVLGEDRELIVRLPESYWRVPSRRYPVLYVLDGSSLDEPAADSAALMARLDLMPETIVVGLPNVSGTGRQRDYTPPFMRQDLDAGSPWGGADRFLAFVRHEVIPFVQQRYRTNPLRMLAGHSRGGLFVCYSLLADPALFQARYAHSPALWRDADALPRHLEIFLRGARRLETFLYLSLGAEENDKMRASFDATRTILTHLAGRAGLAWQADIVAAADHRRNGSMAMPLGLDSFFGHQRRATHRPRPPDAQTPDLKAGPTR